MDNIAFFIFNNLQWLSVPDINHYIVRAGQRSSWWTPVREFFLQESNIRQHDFFAAAAKESRKKYKNFFRLHVTPI
jgi:hypothetical protein